MIQNNNVATSKTDRIMDYTWQARLSAFLPSEKPKDLRAALIGKPHLEQEFSLIFSVNKL